MIHCSHLSPTSTEESDRRTTLGSYSGNFSRHLDTFVDANASVIQKRVVNECKNERGSLYVVQLAFRCRSSSENRVDVLAAGLHCELPPPVGPPFIFS